MTALSALLRERPTDSSGVYRLPADTTVETIAEIAANAGWRLVHADTSSSDDKRAVLTDFQAAFELPEWFGRNLDALVDALRDVDDEPGVLLLWEGGDRLAAANGDDHQRVLAVLRDRARGDAAGRLLTVLKN